MVKFRKDFNKRATSEKFKNKENPKTMKGKILNIARKIGIALGITGTVATTAVYADMKYNDAEISKGIIKMFSGEKTTEKNIVPQGTFEQRQVDLMNQKTKKPTDPKPEPTEGGGEPDDDKQVKPQSNDKLVNNQTNTKTYEGDEIPPTSHKELLAKNEKYKKNFEKVEDLFAAGANKTCIKLAGEGKLSENDSKVYLITTYLSFAESPQLWTTEAKKSYLILKYGVQWNGKTKGEIDTKFGSDMRDARTFLRNGDASTLTMPEYISPETEAKYANLDTDVEF